MGKTEFEDNINKCAQWNGDFSSRRKREAGEEEVSNVPSVMETGSSALNWLRAVRKTRSAEPGSGENKNGKGGKARKGKGGKSRKGKGGNARKARKGKGGKTRSGKRKNGKWEKKDKGTRKKKSQDMQTSTYNKLWCFDLS